VKHEIAQEIAKAAPPVTVTSWAWFHGLTISDLVGWATLAYIALQSAYLLWRWIRQIRRGK
jgi:hypothetical protein